MALCLPRWSKQARKQRAKPDNSREVSKNRRGARGKAPRYPIMINYTIYFQDLKEDVQQELWALVSKRLVDEGLVERDEEETEEQFLNRLQEETDNYINTHNFAFKYKL
jgi:hypothetical protein